ncbi:Uncharacterized protein dnm_075840 [Desulfonema magnum]|uniref:Uncharacterized protein n=1 Tax=Desulfonema magnum TaxID=45655 RepID=A0A975GRZ9_9BACT|nr:Uncharacterized protein dnm_075840 [Desulfonema magnum]
MTVNFNCSILLISCFRKHGHYFLPRVRVGILRFVFFPVSIIRKKFLDFLVSLKYTQQIEND